MLPAHPHRALQAARAPWGIRAARDLPTLLARTDSSCHARARALQDARASAAVLPRGVWGDWEGDR
jgi:hypothetical protein